MLVSELGKMINDKKSEEEAYYKDSQQILGISMGELEMFVNPGAVLSSTKAKQSHSAGKYNSLKGRADFEEKLNNLNSLPEQHEIEEIGETCLRIIEDLGDTMKS